MDPTQLNREALIGGLTHHKRVPLGHHPTPVDHLKVLGNSLGIELYTKRDDCNGLAFGGNKIRQLEYYMGPAVSEGADTVLVTGAVQSNFVRSTAAAARKLGMNAEVQLEARVADEDPLYHASGNVLLDQLLGARIHHFPEGEDEAAADRQLDAIAERLRGEGRKPYVIHLGVDHPPLGALGYSASVLEVLDQFEELPDVVVIPSGSAISHSGFLAGARVAGWGVPVMGICVRRGADVQHPRVTRRARETAVLLGRPEAVGEQDVIVSDAVFAPGYGLMNDNVAEAIRLAAHSEALLLDPVYTGRAMAGLIAAVRSGEIAQGAKVLFINTGGGPALFAYQNKMLDYLGLEKSGAAAPA